MKQSVFFFIFMTCAMMQASDTRRESFCNKVFCAPIKFSLNCLTSFEQDDSERKELDTMYGCEAGPVGCMLKYMVPRCQKMESGSNCCCFVARTTCACCIVYPCYYICCYPCCYNSKVFDNKKTDEEYV